MPIVTLESFRIQNYRSIIDSGWKNLSTDNITILIGQNESGKTSVLEALQSFYTSDVSEDVLRSDRSLPEVSCRFSIARPNAISIFLKKDKIPTELYEQVESIHSFTLSRKWHEDRSSDIYISEGTLFSYYEQQAQQLYKNEQETLEIIGQVIVDSEKLFSSVKQLESELNDSRKKLKESRKLKDLKEKLLKKVQKEDEKLIAQKEFDVAVREYKDQEGAYSNLADEFDKKQSEVKKIEDKYKISCHLQELETTFNLRQTEIENKKEEIQNYRNLADLSSSLRARKKNHYKLDKSLRELKKVKDDFSRISKVREKELEIVWLVVTEKQTYKDAVKKVEEKQRESGKYYSTSDLGELFRKEIPVFEFFEDFSGLLPNKIDFEDILNENEKAEGYQAAKNFLYIAGLNNDILRENNQRILKQRIETLNTDVSINFHDYWSQKVGRNNKINLYFELEHYNYRDPEKKGKPYLEFWIKDRQNRLYPKQRSRGVRWFLSFYLELKAAEANQSGNRVILIDEPGLSLHARAQEDVLKVFEDLKKTMQIVYCTHSPHLVKKDKLYRVLAVQRQDETDDNSETLIYESGRLSEASADTLSPVYSILGARQPDDSILSKKNNIIVPDSTTYYYLQALAKIIPGAGHLKFVPATDEKTIPVLINILVSWQIEFKLLLMGKNSTALKEEIEKTTVLNPNKTELKSVLFTDNFEMIEDIFSTLDFKKHILKKREGITDTNSQYITANRLSRTILATNFVNNLEEMHLSLDDFDDKTVKNLKSLFNRIVDLEISN